MNRQHISIVVGVTGLLLWLVVVGWTASTADAQVPPLRGFVENHLPGENAMQTCFNRVRLRRALGKRPHAERCARRAGLRRAVRGTWTSALPRTLLWSPSRVPAKYQEMLAESRMPTPRGIVQLTVGWCPWVDDPRTVGGCAFDHEIWISPGLNVRYGEDRTVFYHELGHQADFRHLTDRERWLFTRVVGLHGLPWWGLEKSYQHAPVPAEWFAEAYGDCADQGFYIVPRPESPRGFPLGPRSICPMIARMVRR